MIHIYRLVSCRGGSYIIEQIATRKSLYPGQLIFHADGSKSRVIKETSKFNGRGNMKTKTMVYVYKIQRESVTSGKRSGSIEDYYSNTELIVGGLYMHMRGLSGAWRVLELVESYDGREVEHD